MQINLIYAVTTSQVIALKKSYIYTKEMKIRWSFKKQLLLRLTLLPQMAINLCDSNLNKGYLSIFITFRFT